MDTNTVDGTSASDEARKQLHDAIHRAFTAGLGADAVFHSVMEIADAPFSGLRRGVVSGGVASVALETLGAKAAGQVNYWRRKQDEYPAIEDHMDEDGLLNLPDDVGPLLAGRSANGRYDEATWWLETIGKMAKWVDTQSEPSVKRPNEGLVKFAKEIIRCSFQGGDADGIFIQEKAVEFGLLRETVFDDSVHFDPEGHATNGDIWYVFTSALDGVAKATPNESDERQIEEIREVLPTMGSGSWELAQSTWKFEPREGQGEALVYRPMSENMIPFSCPTAICRAPKLMDAQAWEPLARYFMATSPSAVYALLNAYDRKSEELHHAELERDANAELAKANGLRAIEEYKRAEGLEQAKTEIRSLRETLARFVDADDEGRSL